MDLQTGLRDNRVRSFVLRSGRMSKAQKRSYDSLFPLYGLREDEKRDLDLGEFFGNAAGSVSGNAGANVKPLVIEIGFGMGIATAIIAERNPGINYLGLEVHRPGIGRLLWEIEKRNLKNIRVIEGDAVEILEHKVKNNSASGFHIFFPDPWPKKRHHKRRLISRPFTDLLASKLLPGGYIYMASDWPDYAEWALGELSATPGLSNRYNEYAEGQSWRPETKFEQKGFLKNHEVWELFFVKQ